MHQTRHFDRRIQQSLLALRLILVAPCAAQASGTDEMQTYLLSISRLYESLEYERALDQIQLARQLPRSTESEVAISLYEGIIQCELGRQELGTAAFKSALLLRPDAKLPVQVAPKVQQIFELVQQQVKQELASVLSQHEAGRKPPHAASEPTVPPVQSPFSLPITVVSPPSESVPKVDSSKTPQHGGLRRYSLAPAVAGGVLLMAGGASYAVSRGELNRLRTDDPRIAAQGDMQRSVSRGRTWQTVGVSLLSIGALSLATAAGMYVLGTPDTSVAIGVGATENSAFVHGRWP